MKEGLKYTTVPLTRDMKIVLEDYYFDFYGVKHKIPAGFSFDGLSIPFGFQWLVNMNSNENMIQDAIHAFLYSTLNNIATQLQADRRLRDGLKVWSRDIIYYGLCFGGVYSYKQDRKYKQNKLAIESYREHLGLSINIS